MDMTFELTAKYPRGYIKDNELPPIKLTAKCDGVKLFSVVAQGFTDEEWWNLGHVGTYIQYDYDYSHNWLTITTCDDVAIFCMRSYTHFTNVMKIKLPASVCRAAFMEASKLAEIS